MRRMLGQRLVAIGLAACALFAAGFVLGGGATPLGATGTQTITGTTETGGTSETTTTNGESCSVGVSGPRVVCLHCDKKGELKPPKDQPLVVLTASGSPSGGTYAWSVAELFGGQITLAQGTNPAAGAGPEKLFVHGAAPSTQKDDVQVTVTYTVTVGGSSALCSSTHGLTVVKPSSLRVAEEQQFLVRNGEVQGAVPDKYKPAVDKVLDQVPGQPDKKQYAGVILIRFYEVLDQFGDVLQCSGKDGLTEEVFPKTVKQGGTDVTNGIPAQPDRVFQLESEKKKPFAGQTYAQVIRVFGCTVRYNKFVFTRDGVTATEITEQEFNQLAGKK